MTTQQPELIGFDIDIEERRSAEHAAAGLVARTAARVLARRLDRQLEAGARPVEGTALAAHHQRLTSRRERTDLAWALTLVIRDAAEGRDLLNPRAPVHADSVRHASDVIEQVRRRLNGRRDIRARGAARLRLLLADGRGPLYRRGSGSLSAAMRGVLAAL